MSLPNEKNVGAALRYLTDTDESYGRMVARVKAMEYEVKTIRALVLLDATGTVAEKEAKSCSSAPYRAFIESYQNAVADKEITQAKRKTNELLIDVWRSCNANMRKGNI